MTLSRLCLFRRIAASSNNRKKVSATTVVFVGLLLAASYAGDVNGFTVPVSTTTTLTESSSRIFGKLSQRASPASSQQLLSTGSTKLGMSTGATAKESPSSTSGTIPSWEELQQLVNEMPVGIALNQEDKLRKEGKGSAHVRNTIRRFASEDEVEPQITLYRDHAGWYVRAM